MRKLFLTLLLSLFLVSNAWAVSATFLDLISSGGVTCDDCSGSLKFAWHMEDNDSTPDVTLGTPCGCSDGDTIGAETGSPVFSTTQKSDGTYALHINALDEYYSFDVSNDDLIEVDNCKITFDLYIVSYPAAGLSHYFIESRYSSSNYLRIRIKDAEVLVKYNGADTADYISVVVGTGSWVSCEYQAKTGVAGNDHYLICGANSDERDDDLVALAASTTFLAYGDLSGDGAGEYYLDNVKIDPCDRY